MTNDKAPKGAFSGAHTADALDLLEIERRIDRLEHEVSELEASSKLTPGRSNKLAEAKKKLGQLRWARVSASEQVNANLYQSEIYQREVDTAKLRATEQKKLEEVREGKAAKQGGPGYREMLRTYLANWKKQAEPVSSPEKSKNAEAGADPE